MELIKKKHNEKKKTTSDNIYVYSM